MKQNKINLIRVRVTDKQRERLDTVLKRDEVNVSEWLRKVIDNMRVKK